MSPLASVVVLFVAAIAVVALFAARLRLATAHEVAVLPDPEPAPKPAALEGALVAGD
ncbi:hypothetical protein [Cognatilysobacter bugurensis]|uniref:hypothetical protein n=1 Tax=Cognatilysobacter bugurensis TaxID=543356 RepID=UPI001679B4DE|nr:hypothetical protein [Lysobacter bugurensis]